MDESEQLTGPQARYLRALHRRDAERVTADVPGATDPVFVVTICGDCGSTFGATLEDVEALEAERLEVTCPSCAAVRLRAVEDFERDMDDDELRITVRRDDGEPLGGDAVDRVLAATADAVDALRDDGVELRVSFPAAERERAS